MIESERANALERGRERNFFQIGTSIERVERDARYTFVEHHCFYCAAIECAATNLSDGRGQSDRFDLCTAEAALGKLRYGVGSFAVVDSFGDYDIAGGIDSRRYFSR